MKWLVFLLFSFLALTIQASVLTWPLVIGLLVSLAVIERTASVFFFAFFIGLFSDALLFHTIGLSSVFFTLFVFTIFLYQRKFEIQTIPFVFFAAFIGSGVYMAVFGYSAILFSSFSVSVFSVLFFSLMMKVFGKKKEDVNVIF